PTRVPPTVERREQESPVPASARFCHNDLCADHVLVDARCHLTGLVDWTDAMVTDPVLDFAGLITIAGWRFVDLVLARYPLELDETFVERLERTTRALTRRWLEEAEAVDPAEVPKHREWVARAFAGGPRRQAR
ncbi:MAG: phosphotransferase, partial [Candidatus Dormibacteraceae bacterium]